MKKAKKLIICPGCGSVQAETVHYCPLCGLRIVSDNPTICPECGGVVERGRLCAACGCVLTKQCAHCGAAILGGENYCPVCGAGLSDRWERNSANSAQGVPP